MEHFEMLTAETLKDMENKLNEGSQCFGIKVEVVSPIAWDEREARYQVAVKVKVREPYSRVYLATADNGKEDTRYLPCDSIEQAKAFIKHSQVLGWKNTEIEEITYKDLDDRGFTEYDQEADYCYMNYKIFND